eukprot:8966854-Pyramimonas_sp.AAC.1
MQQTNAHDVSESVSVHISSVALPQPELRAKIDSTSEDHSNNTNSFASLARVADRVQTSGCNRRTRLIILLSTENRQYLLK